MAYSKINIISFEGLNSNTSPELIKDGEARDILNLRMEKIGKLTSRNGYIYGMFSSYDPTKNPSSSFSVYANPPIYDDLETGVPNRQMQSFIYQLGVLGIGEITLSEKWDILDTDKLMVYFVRGMATQSDDKQANGEDSLFKAQVSETTDYRFRGTYLFSPITGRYRNVLLIHDLSGTNIGYVADKTDIDPQGMDEQMRSLYVENRYLPAYMNAIWENISENTFTYGHWINHYIKMRQYRRSLIVSDRVNGDLIIEDEYDRQKTQGFTPDHKLHIRPNTLAEFDISTVGLSARFDTDQENDKAVGVESGMALYNYMLPEKTIKVTQDHFPANGLSNPDYFPEEFSEENKVAERVLFDEQINRELDGGMSNALITIKGVHATSSSAVTRNSYRVEVNTSKEYIFTNAEDPTKYREVLGELELPKNEYKNKDGIIKEDTAANVYVWDDYKLQYYPSNGKNFKVEGNYFLSEEDRDWDKLTPGLPRIEDLKVKDKYGRDVPLGAWRYRFVWDYGDGTYSAPSPELLCPDILWSATSDVMVEGDDSVNGEDWQYERYKKLNDIDILNPKSFLNYADPEMFQAYSDNKDTKMLISPSLIYEDSNDIKLTPFGQLFYDLKRELYGTHRFAPTLDNTNYEAINTDIITSNARSDISTLITCYFPGNSVEMKGWIWEGCDMDIGLEDKIDGKYLPGYFQDIGYTQYVKQGMGKLIIPIYQQNNKSYTYNSLFDDYGRYRAAYLNIKEPKYQLVFPGNNPVLGGVSSDGSLDYRKNSLMDVIWSDIKGTEADVYLNIVPIQYDNYGTLTGYGDNNNDQSATATSTNYNSNLLAYGRAYTLLRAVQKDVDRLINTKTEIKTDVADRLILRGLAGFPIISKGLRVSSWSQKYYDATAKKEKDQLGYQDRRIYPYANIVDIVSTSKEIDSNGSLDGIKINDKAIYEATTSKEIQAKYLYFNHNRGYTSYQGGAIDVLWTDTTTIVFDKKVSEYGIKKGDMITFRYDCTQYNMTDRNSRNTWFPSIKTGKEYIVKVLEIRTTLQAEDTILIKYDTYAKIYTSPILPLTETYTCSNVTINTSPADFEYIQNLDVTLYADAERFIGIEQLTSYFPSSLIFKSPRMGIEIPNDFVPKRAKNLLIFRTLNSTNNTYQSSNYGLVKKVKIKRDDNGNAITEMVDDIQVPGVQEGKEYKGVYFFDDVKDELLDFGNQPSQYDGSQISLKSRFNINVNERVYFANFIETYQPKTPKDFVDDKLAAYDIGLIGNTNITSRLVEDTDIGYPPDINVSIGYKYIYKDKAGVYSQAGTTSAYTPIKGASNPDNLNTVFVFSYLPKGFDESIESLEIYRTKNTLDPNPKYYYIGECKDSEGIFVDTNLPDGDELPDLSPDVENYESGLRWSELYKPDWIKANSFVEFKSGDGDQITGLEVIYGNLVIFKETSIHRVAVQGGEVPITRTDEVSGQIGCIAPNTLINVQNTLFFLSWEGFMMYDNNQLKKIDGKFDEELQFILQSMRNKKVTEAGVDHFIKDESIRDASCGFNTAYNEIYLNIPMLPTKHNSEGVDDGRQYEEGQASMYQESSDNATKTYFDRPVNGHIYVINLDKGYITKYAYPTTVADARNTDHYIREIIDTRQLIRLYHTNSQGEFRSADILPIRYDTSIEVNKNSKIIRSGIYVESPYSFTNAPPYKDTDDLLDGINLGTDLLAVTFPTDYIIQDPIKSKYKSKYFTGNAETLIKRVRQVAVNIFTRGGASIICKSFPFESQNQAYADERIKDVFGGFLPANQILPLANETFVFNPSITSTHPITQAVLVGTGSNILQVVPKSISSDPANAGGVRSDDTQGQTGTGQPIASDKYNDWYGKPIRFSVDIESTLRTQINSFIINWRPIHTYLE